MTSANTKHILDCAILTVCLAALVVALSQGLEMKYAPEWTCSTDSECEAQAAYVDAHRGLEGQR